MVRCKTASRRSAAALYCCRSRLAQEEFRGFRGRILRFAPGRFARSGVARWTLNPRRCPALRDAPDRLLNPFGQAFPIYQRPAIAVIERAARSSVLVKSILWVFKLLLGYDDARRGHQHCYSEPDRLGFVAGERLF
jgi:hypothetical protein